MAHERQTDDLLDDLKILRKGKGFTPERIMKAGNLTQILGGENLGYETLKWRFIDAVDHLSVREDKTLLLAVYGLTEGYEDFAKLSERREQFSRKIAYVKEDTLREREDAAISELAAILFNNRTTVNLGGRIDAPRHNRVIVEQRITTVIENYFPIKDTHEITLLSFVDGVRKVDNYYGFTLPAHITVKPLSGIREISSRIYEGKGSQHVLYFREKLKRNEAFTFAFECLPKVEPKKQPNFNRVDLEPDRISHSGVNITEPMRKLVISIEFREKSPREIWWYKNKTRVARPGLPDESNRLIPQKTETGSEVVKVELTTLYSGYGSGVAWRW